MADITLHLFRCPLCGIRAWAEGGTKVSCTSCGVELRPQPSRRSNLVVPDEERMTSDKTNSERSHKNS